MLKVLKILVTAHALVGSAAMLSACGQKGPLFLPNTPESAGRATLPETLKPWPARPASSAPATPTRTPDTTTETSAPQTAPAATTAPSP
ncbi:MAG: lipoprotein [Pseudomonadota bacterium]